MHEETIKNNAHWTNLASKWSHNGAPLGPCSDDIAICRKLVSEWCADQTAASPHALILGVTPQLFHLDWPENTVLRAVDRNQSMIDQVWPGEKDAVDCGNWLDLPYPNESLDLVFCDGGLHLQSYPDEQLQLANKLADVIAPNGYCSFRLFIAPKVPRTVSAILADLAARRIANLNHLKMHLFTAAQANSGDGVQLAYLWNLVHADEPDQAQLAEKIDWPLDHLQAINAYKDSPTSYHFIGLDEVIDLFCQGTGDRFVVHRIEWPDYLFGDQCPTIIFRKREGIR